MPVQQGAVFTTSVRHVKAYLHHQYAIYLWFKVFFILFQIDPLIIIIIKFLSQPQWVHRLWSQRTDWLGVIDLCVVYNWHNVFCHVLWSQQNPSFWSPRNTVENLYWQIKHSKKGQGWSQQLNGPYFGIKSNLSQHEWWPVWHLERNIPVSLWRLMLHRAPTFKVTWKHLRES